MHDCFCSLPMRQKFRNSILHWYYCRYFTVPSMFIIVDCYLTQNHVDLYVPEWMCIIITSKTYKPNQIISQLQSYSSALWPTSLHLLNLLQSQFSLNDGMHTNKYNVVVLCRTEPCHYPDYTTHCHCSRLICSHGDHQVPSGDGLEFKS